jgi:hypothetical protein
MEHGSGSVGEVDTYKNQVDEYGIFPVYSYLKEIANV